MGRITSFKLALATLVVIPAPALADWRVAETKNFIYYSEADDAELTATVQELEKFDTLIRAFTNNRKPVNPAKLVIFEVDGLDDVRNTLPYPAGSVAGYYTTTSTGPFLVTFRKDIVTSKNSIMKASNQPIRLGPEVRQHEYLHHYMYQYFNTNYPVWYSEGFAEYYGTMAFPEENVAEVGHAPIGRVDAIRFGEWLHVRDLLKAKSYADVDNISALYAQGWLLTHMGAQNPVRGKQLQQYLAGVVAGEDYEKAAEAAFGDLDELNKELRKHSRGFNSMRLSLKPLNLGPVDIRTLSPAESALMHYKIRLKSGMKVSDLPAMTRNAAQILAREPGSVMGHEVVAQLQNMAGEHTDASATADRLLALDPGNVTGMTEKGKALLGVLDTASTAQQWADGRAWLEKAAAASATATDPRVALFQSYEKQGVMPAVEAQNRLVEAFQLIPQNDDIRYLLARDFEQRGMIDDAIGIIKPAAFGAFDGDEGEKRKRQRALAKAADRYTNISNYESPIDMLKRLEGLKAAQASAGEAVETTAVSETAPTAL